MGKLIKESRAIWYMQKYYDINAHNRDGHVKIRSGIQRGTLELQLKRKKLMGRTRTR
jgi:hypothetical protein